MGSELLVNEKIEAGKNFLVEFRKRYPVEAAFWLRENDDYSSSKFRIVTEELPREARLKRFADSQQILEAMQDPNLTPLEMNFLAPDEPLAKAAMEVYPYYSNIPKRVRREYFGGNTVEELYLYPPSITNPPTMVPPAITTDPNAMVGGTQQSTTG